MRYLHFSSELGLGAMRFGWIGLALSGSSIVSSTQLSFLT
jgi:hypothetical protein